MKIKKKNKLSKQFSLQLKNQHHSLQIPPYLCSICALWAKHTHSHTNDVSFQQSEYSTSSPKLSGVCLPSRISLAIAVSFLFLRMTGTSWPPRTFQGPMVLDPLPATALKWILWHTQGVFFKKPAHTSEQTMSSNPSSGTIFASSWLEKAGAPPASPRTIDHVKTPNSYLSLTTESWLIPCSM